MKSWPEECVNVFARVVLGFIAGAFCGAIAGVALTGIYLFGIYLMFHKVNFDSPGLIMLPIIGAPFGAIVGAALGAVLAARRPAKHGASTRDDSL